MVFAVFHLLGWREATTILSGTPLPGDSYDDTAAKALFYLVSYFASVVAVPILVIAAALQGLLRKWLTKPEADRNALPHVNTRRVRVPIKTPAVP